MQDGKALAAYFLLKEVKPGIDPLHLGGHLNWYDPHKRASLAIDLTQPTALVEILKQLNVPAGEVAITVLNGRVVDLQAALVSNADRVELYPPIGGG